MKFYYGNISKKQDVTELAILKFIKSNSISIEASVSFNEIFGDVLPGQPKTLQIYFDDNTTMEFPESRYKDYLLHFGKKERVPRTTTLDLCSLLKVDKIFLLNLPSRVDRLEESRVEFNKLCIPNNQWECFEAYKGADLAVQQRFQKEFTAYCAKQPITRATNGAFGCLLSHFSMIKAAKERGYKRVLILEDDFEPTHLFDDEKLLAKIGLLDFDMFYFSTTTMAPPLPTNDPDFMRVQRAFAGCAYIVNHTIFDIIIDQCLTYAMQIDVFYADIIQKQFKAFSLPKSVITQREGYSDIEQIKVKYNFET